jgi:hypothetical protein
MISSRFVPLWHAVPCQPLSKARRVGDCACSQSVDRVHLMAYDRCAKVPCEHSTPAEADAAVRSALKVRAPSRLALSLLLPAGPRKPNDDA